MISRVSVEVIDRPTEEAILPAAGGSLPPGSRTRIGAGDLDGGKLPPFRPTGEEKYSDWTAFEQRLMQRFSHLPFSVFTLPGRRILAVNRVPIDQFFSGLDLSLGSETRMATYRYEKFHLVGSYLSDPRILLTDGVVMRLSAEESDPRSICKQEIDSTYIAWVGRKPTQKDPSLISIVSPLRKPELRSQLEALKPRYLSI